MNDKDFELEAYEKSIKRKRKSRAKITAVTAAVILAVLLVNIAFSVLSHKFLLFTDLTSTKYTTIDATMYTLTDTTRDLIEREAIPMISLANEDKSANTQNDTKLNIIFCAEQDIIESDELLRYISYTARQLQKEFPDHINVQYVNIAKNPTAVQKYKVTSAANIYPSNVIVEFGSEFTVLSYKAFFTSNSGTEAPWAYNGEMRARKRMCARKEDGYDYVFPFRS